MGDHQDPKARNVQLDGLELDFHDLGIARVDIHNPVKRKRFAMKTRLSIRCFFLTTHEVPFQTGRNERNYTRYCPAAIAR
jgi:hypothetical protein